MPFPLTFSFALPVPPAISQDPSPLLLGPLAAALRAEGAVEVHQYGDLLNFRVPSFDAAWLSGLEPLAGLSSGQVALIPKSATQEPRICVTGRLLHTVIAALLLTVGSVLFEAWLFTAVAILGITCGYLIAWVKLRHWLEAQLDQLSRHVAT